MRNSMLHALQEALDGLHATYASKVDHLDERHTVAVRPSITLDKDGETIPTGRFNITFSEQGANGNNFELNELTFEQAVFFGESWLHSTWRP